MVGAASSYSISKTLRMRNRLTVFLLDAPS